MITRALFFKKTIGSNRNFAIIVIIFILSLGIAVCVREGKDLKVGLFGVEQTLHKKSPYENPTDPNRPLFRYAPGFAILQYPFLLKSKMVAPFEFKNITPSVLAWYAAVIASLFLSAMILLRLIPSASREISLTNLKLSFLMAMPLIGYELANGQNKLMALFFMLLALLLFEKKRMFLSALSFNLALTIYIPSAVFVLYFLLRSKGRYVVSFIVGALVVFVLLPSLIFGVDFNIFLLKDWFVRCLKPFFFTISQMTYIDLRTSSQSLPSAISRIFVSGHTGTFKYLISPLSLHMMIMFFSGLILLFSCLAVWKNSQGISKGLGIAVFLILALILPQYCIYYTWAWLFVVYLAAFNYMSFSEVTSDHRRLLRGLVIFLFMTSWLISVRPFNHLSFLFWGTLFMGLGLVSVLLSSSTQEA